MALFHLKELCSPADDDPIHWNYDRTELIADGIVHAFGVAFGLVGAIALFLVSPTSTTVDTSVIVIYAVGLLTMLILSATYNLWPVSPASGCFAGLTTPPSICLLRPPTRLSYRNSTTPVLRPDF